MESRSEAPAHSDFITTLIISILLKPPSKRTNQDLRTLALSLEKNEFFQNLVISNGPSSLYRLSSFLLYESCTKNAFLFVKGSVGTRFYIILRGKVGVMIPNLSQNGQNQPLPKISLESHKKSFGRLTLRNSFASRLRNSSQMQAGTTVGQTATEEMMEVKELGPGESFGELALISNKPRASSILCKEDCDFAFLEKEGFEKVLKELAEKQLHAGLNELRKFSIFSSLMQKNLMNFYYGLKTSKFMKGQPVYKEGTVPEDVFLIKEGEFMVFKEAKFKGSKAFSRKLVKVALLQRGDLLGDEDFTMDEEGFQRDFSAKCESNEGELYSMRFADFSRYLKRDTFSLYEGLMAECKEKKARFLNRFFESMKIEEKALGSDIQVPARKKLKELFTSQNFYLMRGQLNDFNKSQEKLGNCSKLKTLRRLKMVNEVEEVIDGCSNGRSKFYESSMMNAFKQEMEQIEKNSGFVELKSLRSMSTELTNNPLLLKNIGFFSSKYQRVLNKIAGEKEKKKK